MWREGRLLGGPLCIAILAIACKPFSEDVSGDGDAAGGGQVDGGAGAVDAGVDAGASPCGPELTTFCDTFERESPPSLGWSEAGGGFSVTIDDATAVSPTRSLVIALTGKSGSGLITRALPSDHARQVRITFAMLVDPAMPYTQVLSLRLSDAKLMGDKFIIVTAENGGLEVAEQDFTAPNPPFFASTPAGKTEKGWSSYELEVDLDAPSVSLLRSGAVVAKRALVRAYAKALDLRVGVTYTTTGAPSTLRFDDVGIVAR